MLPNMRIVVVTIAAALVGVSIALGLMTSSRMVSVFAVGLRSAQGSPISRTLPEPPEWKESVARAAERRAQELDRLLDLQVAPSTTPASATPPEPETTGSVPDRATQAPKSADGPAPEAPALHPQ